MPGSTDDGGGLAARLDRLDAYQQIRQLPHRYGLALDTRNIDDLVALFIDDVQVGRDNWGRAALREWFVRSFSKFQTSIHFVGNHVIDLDDEDHAHGVVYCRDEIDRPGEWMVGMIQYWDTYERARWVLVLQAPPPHALVRRRRPPPAPPPAPASPAAARPWAASPNHGQAGSATGTKSPPSATSPAERIAPMAEDRTLLAHIVLKLATHPENIAVEALGPHPLIEHANANRSGKPAAGWRRGDRPNLTGGDAGHRRGGRAPGPGGL